MPSVRSEASPGARRGRAAQLRKPRTRAPDADAIAVLQQFRELFRVSQRHFQRIEARCGVSGAQLWALLELQRQPGLTISELARRLSVHLSTSSNLLVKLERHGLVRRERVAADHRLVRVQLTAAGKKVLGRAARPAEGVIPDALSRLPAAVLQRLHKDLAALLDLIGQRSPHAAMKPLAEP